MSLLIVAFFVFKNCRAEITLKITNVQFKGEKADEDYIEFTNTSSEDINLKNYRLAKKTSSGKRYNIKSWSSEEIIPAGDKYIWASSKIEGFPESINADTSTKETISETNGIAIILGNLDEGTVIDCLNWLEEEPEEEEEEEEETKTDYAGKVKINEIYPAPDTKDPQFNQEFVEIINLSEGSIDFSKWSIKDSKNTKPDISKTDLLGNYFVFYGKFSLNNDKNGDTAILYDDKGNEVDSRKYESGKSKKSYAFDGSAWRWTSTPTPGEANQFDKILSGKISMDDKIYAGVYANFSVKADKGAEKFTWDFGDKHKSYLKVTRHKYEKTGKYNASLKITGEKCEDKLYEFLVKVENYDAPKIRIKSINPNPKGNDTQNEWIELENKSKKKVDLINWSVATGWDNLYNHPIREKFEIKSGKTKKITKDICAFTLNNQKTKIELRDPSGKVVNKIKYDRENNKIEEDEIYENVDSEWKWIEPPETTEEIKNNHPIPSGENVRRTGDGEISDTNNPINLDMIGKYSPDPAWKIKSENKIKLANLSKNIKTPDDLNPIVLGASTAKNLENYQSFTKPTYQKHWAAKISNFLLIKLNLAINRIIFYF